MLTVLPILGLLPLLVIDGDTVEIDGRRIRIANIDAPEIHQSHCDAEKRLGLVAKKRMGELLAARTFVVIDGDPATGRTKDRHGRVLATIRIGDRDVGELLIEEGLARPWEGKRKPWCDPD